MPSLFHPSMPDNSPKSLRRRCRAARRSLNPARQQEHARLAVRQLRASGLLHRHRRIALYLAADGELDPAPIAQMLTRLGRQIYLPVLHPWRRGSLWFLPWAPGNRLVANRFGIPEPDIRHRAAVPTWSIDLVLMPLVAFDKRGTRLGMGGGFYDRTLGYHGRHPLLPRPRLVGLAHECQQVDQLVRQPWDIPLEGVITEQRFYRFE